MPRITDDDWLAGRWRIRTTLGAFSTYRPGHHQLRDNLRRARLVLGHTRWATQGATTLDNASPLPATSSSRCQPDSRCAVGAKWIRD